MNASDLPAVLQSFPVVIGLPVQWGDQDAYGHVNNTVYFRWYESARIAYIERLGFSQMLRGGGRGPILAAIHGNYRRQLVYPDKVHIGARVTRLGNTSLTMTHVIYSEKLQAAVADGESVVVMFDYAANRPVRVPEELRVAIRALEREAVAE